MTRKRWRNVVPVDVAERLDYESELPYSDALVKALQSTPGVSFDPDIGIEMPVSRRQHSSQAGMPTVRGGIFYLPKQIKYKIDHPYSGTGGYGGSQLIQGRTLVKKPLVVEAYDGGLATTLAYRDLHGKDVYDRMVDDIGVMTGYDSTTGAFRRGKRRPSRQELEDFLVKWDGAQPELAHYMLETLVGYNRLPVAIREHIVAGAVREAGYDSVLARVQEHGKHKLMELFDVRESEYPSPSGAYKLHPKFAELQHNPVKKQRLRRHRNPNFKPGTVNMVGAIIGGLLGGLSSGYRPESVAAYAGIGYLISSLFRRKS